MSVQRRAELQWQRRSRVGREIECCIFWGRWPAEVTPAGDKCQKRNCPIPPTRALLPANEPMSTARPDLVAKACNAWSIGIRGFDIGISERRACVWTILKLDIQVSVNDNSQAASCGKGLKGHVQTP